MIDDLKAAHPDVAAEIDEMAATGWPAARIAAAIRIGRQHGADLDIYLWGLADLRRKINARDAKE